VLKKLFKHHNKNDKKILLDTLHRLQRKKKKLYVKLKEKKKNYECLVCKVVQEFNGEHVKIPSKFLDDLIYELEDKTFDIEVDEDKAALVRDIYDIEQLAAYVKILKKIVKIEKKLHIHNN
jgi:flagellar motor component MotA